MIIEITDNSGMVRSEMQAAVLRALTKCGLVAEGYAKRLCVVGTPESTGIPGYIGGTLRNSITFAVSGKPANTTQYKDNSGRTRGRYSGTAPDDGPKCVYIGSNVEYAAYVELGTRRMKAKPYLKPAIADHAQQYRDIIENELKNG